MLDTVNQMNEEKVMQHRMGRVKRIHMIGIGGSGMCGIAEVLINLGYDVSGSDLSENKSVKRLVELGAKITFGHTAEVINNCDVVVTSSAINDENVELKAAIKQRIPVVPRAEMLAELMRFRYGIAVAGTHGKTTTTSLVSSLLAEAGLDPTFVIGGLLNSAGTNARLGAGKYLVAEADESDASFLCLQPMLAIITNIDADHLSTYEGDFQRLKEAFVEFLHHLPFYGIAVLCIDDPEVRNILDQVTRTFVTYGFSDDADFQAFNISQKGCVTEFDVKLLNGEKLVRVSISLPGSHNVLNALAAIAVAYELGVDEAAIFSGLKHFQGIARRFQSYGEVQSKAAKFLLIDDYAHHPREIDATISGVRSGWPEARLVLAFQPHRYTRTKDLFDDFAEVLSKADVLILTEVYAAGEKSIAGADANALARAIRVRGKVDPIVIKDINKLDETLLNLVEDDDLVLTLGAGNIGSVASKLKSKMSI